MNDLILVFFVKYFDCQYFGVPNMNEIDLSFDKIKGLQKCTLKYIQNSGNHFGTQNVGGGEKCVSLFAVCKKRSSFSVQSEQKNLDNRY